MDNKKDLTKKEKEFAALSYLWVFSLLVYFSPESLSPYVKHHAKQAVFLFFLSLFLYFIGGFFVYLNLIVFFLMVLGIVESARGEYYMLPVVGDWLEGNFNPDKQFYLIFHWIHKVKKMFRADKGVFKKQADKKKEVLMGAELSGLVIKKWPVNIQKKAEELKKKALFLKVEERDDRIVFMKRKKEVAIFGGVSKDLFKLAFHQSHLNVPADFEFSDWSLKIFKMKEFREEIYEAICDLISSS